MRIENEMLSRFNKKEEHCINSDISVDLDFFFDNVMDTVVDYFKDKETVLE